MQVAGETQARRGKENNPSLNFDPDFSKSKIPMPIKNRPMPDFKKLHESWQTKFHQGKAQSKKAGTRPCPFGLTQKGERFEMLPAAELGTTHPWQGYPESFHSQPPPTAGPQTLHGRGPLKEVHLCPSNGKNLAAPRNATPGKGSTGPDFKLDPGALASILANVGLSDTQGLSGKHSLPLRVPVHGSVSGLQAGPRVPTGRMSAYAGPMHPHHLAKGVMPRPSILAEKGAEQRDPVHGLRAHPRPPSLRQDMGVSKKKPNSTQPAVKTDLSPKDTMLQAAEGCPIGVESKEPQQPKGIRTVGGASDPAKLATASCARAPGVPIGSQSSADGAPPEKAAAAHPCSVPTVDREAFQDAALGNGQTSKADVGHGSSEFVTDPSALASILSNTGLSGATMGNCKKLSLAQRVPVRGKGVTSLYAFGSSKASIGAAYATRPSFAPSVSSSRMSCMPSFGLLVPERERTPRAAPWPRLHPEEFKPSPLGSARRVLDTNPASSRLRSLPKRRCPIFPKTPQARAVEVANRRLNTEARSPEAARHSVNEATPQSSRPTRLKWYDDLSPRSAPQDVPETPDDEPAVPLEKIACRLFLETNNVNTHQDGEGHSGKKKLILEDLARRRQHIERLEKQLEEEKVAEAAAAVAVALALQGSPEHATANNLKQLPRLEHLTLSQVLSRWAGTKSSPLASTGPPQLSCATAHWHDLQAGIYGVPKPRAMGTEMPFPHLLASNGPLVMPGLSRLQDGGSSGIEHRLSLAGAPSVPISEAHCLSTGIPYEHKSMTGGASFEHKTFTAVSILRHKYSNPAVAISEHRHFYGIPGTSSAEHGPFSGIPGTSSAEHGPFSGIPGASSAEHGPFSGIPGASSAEHGPFSGIPGASSAEHGPFSGIPGASSAEHGPFSGIPGASSAEHGPFSGIPGTSSAEHGPFSGIPGTCKAEHGPFSGIPGTCKAEHGPFSGIPGTCKAEHGPFSGIPGTSSAEHGPFSGIPGASSAEHGPISGIPGASSAEHGPISGIPGASSAEHGPFSGIPGTCSAEHRTFSGNPGTSSAEHRTFSGNPGTSSAEHLPCSAGIHLPDLTATSTALNVGTTTTFSSQGPVCSNLLIQPSKVPAGRCLSLDAPTVRPPAHGHLRTQQFRHFQEACLDEECDFYLSRPTASCLDTLRSDTSCRNPLATMLEQEEAMHFSPIKSPRT